MPAELLDIIDNHDRVIGTATKAQAHKLGFIHRVVVAYVFDQKGRVFLQIKNGHYDHSIGGHVAKGENYQDALLREAEEELSLKGTFSYLGKIYSDESDDHSAYKHMYAIYQGNLPKKWVFKPNDEVKDIIAIEIDDVLKMMNASKDLFTPGMKNTINYLSIQL